MKFVGANGLTYDVFQKWVGALKDEPEVKPFFKLLEQCFLHLMQPDTNEPPSLDYSFELPARMSSETLIAIY